MKIHQAIKALTVGLDVVKVKIYRLNGLTVYSSEFSQIGMDKSNNLSFAKSAREGIPASKFGHRETFNGINGPLRDRYIVESYLPIWGQKKIGLRPNRGNAPGHQRLSIYIPIYLNYIVGELLT